LPVCLGALSIAALSVNLGALPVCLGALPVAALSVGLGALPVGLGALPVAALPVGLGALPVGLDDSAGTPRHLWVEQGSVPSSPARARSSLYI